MATSDTDMMDVEPVTASAASKGKGRADNAYMDNDNLPWCVPGFARLFVLTVP